METCDKCGQALPQPQTEWMTTQEVIARFGFDPTPHSDTIKSKLQPGTFTRVWLKDSIEARAAAT